MFYYTFQLSSKLIKLSNLNLLDENKSIKMKIPFPCNDKNTIQRQNNLANQTALKMLKMITLNCKTQQ